MEEEVEPGDSYDDWARNISKEYHRKRQHSNPNNSQSTGKAKKKLKKEQDEKQKEFQRKLEQEHAEYIKKNTKKDKTKLVEMKKKYEEKFTKLLGMEAEGMIGFSNIPWPHAKKTGLERIKEFLLCDIDEKDEETKKKYLKDQQVRWHPDRFTQKFDGKLKEEDKEKIMGKVKDISQAINVLISEDKR